MRTSRSVVRSSDPGCLVSGFCSSGRGFAPRFLQTPPRGDALALRSHFTSIRLCRGLAPPGYRTCSAHDPSDEPAAPHAGIPDNELPPWQGLERMAWHRARMRAVRAQVRSLAARLLAEHGVEGANDRLPPDVSVDSLGVVRFDGQWAQDQ